MTQPPRMTPVESVVAESPAVAATGKKAAAGLALRGDEVIQLSLRPSPWCIAVYSFKLVVGVLMAGAVMALAARGRSTLGVTVALWLLVLLLFGGIVVATLFWASRLYVLTNRRVICFRGVFNVNVRECALTQVAGLELRRQWYHPLLKLGTLAMQPREEAQAELLWEHVARPEEVHEILARAISKARMP